MSEDATPTAAADTATLPGTHPEPHPGLSTPQRLSKKRRRRLDLMVVILLSTIAMLTAWCGFESSQWGAHTSVSFSLASSARMASVSAESAARDQLALDLAVYMEWFRATANEDAELATYIVERFSPALAAAFTAWQADPASATSPLRHPDYVLPDSLRAQDLGEQADAYFADALSSSDHSGQYARYGVLLALALFLGALSQRDIALGLKRALLTLAAAVTTGSVIAMAITLPVMV